MYCKVPNNAYLCTQKIKGRVPAFGLTRTFSFVRGALHVAIRKPQTITLW